MPQRVLGPLALSEAGVDRSAHRRRDPDWLRTTLATPQCAVLPVSGGRLPGRITEEGGQSAAFVPQWRQRPVEDLAVLDPVWLYLGVVAGREHVAALLAEPQANWFTLREVTALIGTADGGLAATAVALAHWHHRHRHCSRCGAATVPTDAGWMRRCPAEGSEHYPRTDPAVIMAVVDEQDRILLAHNPAWPTGRFSTLAGFVEPGESLEDAVRRETFEETNVQVGDVDYLGSQPWPFPGSLMIGCRARATSTEITVDPHEVDEARWFSRADFETSMRSGDMAFPSTASISRRLIEHWYGAAVPDRTNW